MRQNSLSAVLVSLGLICSVLFIVPCANAAGESLKKNKEIAAMYVEEVLEKGNIDTIVDKYLAEDVVVHFPSAFKAPVSGSNVIKGAEAHRNVAKVWKSETAHNVDIAEVIAEGNKVVVLATVDRVFNISGEQKVFNDHPMAFIFTFKNGKIVDINMIFDVIDTVEQQKSQKYGFGQ